MTKHAGIDVQEIARGYPKLIHGSVVITSLFLHPTAGEQYGFLYLLDNTNNTMYAVAIGSNNSDLIILATREKGSNITSNPFEPQSDGSGEQALSLEEHSSLVYDTHLHHAYIAMGDDIIILTLNSENPVYERLHIGHTPLQIKVYLYAGLVTIFVLYEENSRGYVVIYRKVEHQWRSVFTEPTLLYSPAWYDLDKLSNVIFFLAEDFYVYSHTVYVAVAVGWNVHICELFDGTYRTVEAELPCDNITRLLFNEQKQTMFIECLETTQYFDYRGYRFLRSSAFDTVGTTYFSQDERYGAIVHDTSGVSIVTMFDLHIRQHDSEEPFYYFRLASSLGKIAYAEFVSINRSKHYFCYAEVGGLGINCIDVELAMQNIDRPGLAVSRLPNTADICNKASCSSLYAHHDLLAVSRRSCTMRECKHTLMVFNMSTLQNTWNGTGIRAEFLAWKPHPRNLTTTPTEPTASLSSETPTSEIPSSNIPTSETSASEIPTSETPTSEIPTSETPTSETLSSDVSTPHTSTAIDPEATTDLAATLASCEEQLHLSEQSYQTLLWITIAVCVTFCIAMIILILILVTFLCLSKGEKSDACKCCTHCNNEYTVYEKTKK